MARRAGDLPTAGEPRIEKEQFSDSAFFFPLENGLSAGCGAGGTSPSSTSVTPASRDGVGH